ncbi:hypothetical protein ACKWTF_010055 [Chironomus riparius]
MKFIYFVVAALSILFIQVNGLRVLGIIPFPSKSHFAIGNGIIESLVDAGHDVTVMSPYPQKKNRENYHEIDVSKILEIFESDKHEVNPFVFGQFPAVGVMFMLAKMNSDIVDLFMANKEVQKFINEDQKYDICIFETFLVDSLLGIAEKTDCVIVSFLTFAAVRWTDDMTGNDSPTSYVPNPFLHYTDRMSFKERLWNTAFSLIERGIYQGYYMPRQRKLYSKYFPNAKRSFEEIYFNTSIFFSNTHVSSNTIRPSMPNIVEIAGIHVKPVKPLPVDIQEFLDSATDGAILFSMGSFIQSKQWPVEKREAFVRTFGKLKQKILWKYENETLPNNPGNIKIGSWIPQRDILAHPNVKLFITHGGLLGTTEAIVEGVPILGIPIFGDQKLNMAKSVMKGYGLQINFDDVTEETVTQSINELLSNPKYKSNAVEISERFKDRPMTPQQSVVYWTEYAARHQGASHLKAQSTTLSFIEFHLIDVYCTLLAIFIAFGYIKFVILRMIFRRIFKKSPEKQKRS